MNKNDVMFKYFKGIITRIITYKKFLFEIMDHPGLFLKSISCYGKILNFLRENCYEYCLSFLNKNYEYAIYKAKNFKLEIFSP